MFVVVCEKMRVAVVILVLWTSQSFALFEGDVCQIREQNVTGGCIRLSECEYAKKLLKSQKIPSTCGFIRNEPLVCCPRLEELRLSGQKSSEMCNKYFDRSYQVYAVAVGVKAEVQEFPHMAAIGYDGEQGEIVWLCGGTLISHYFILTAAHCARSRDFGPAKWIRLGDLDLKNTTEGANPVDVPIARTYVHPEYRSSSHYHDVALFEVSEEILFIPWFKPACLHTTKILPVNIFEATGWGKTDFFGDSSSHLMKVSLNLIDHALCAKKYLKVSQTRLAQGIRDDLQICAGDDKGKDTCPGDSGGPLHYLDEGNNKLVRHFIVAGITSFGKGCGGENTAGVYTRVSSYVEWIENIVWDKDHT